MDEYPIYFLHIALDILVEKGEYSFEKYCKSVNMPMEDCERVKNKFNCSYNITKLARGIG